MSYNHIYPQPKPRFIRSIILEHMIGVFKYYGGWIAIHDDCFIASVGKDTPPFVPKD